MKRRKRDIDRVLDALAHDGPLPTGTVADDGEVDEVRAAIELRASRPAADLPTQEFVETLAKRLRDETAPHPAPHAVTRRKVIVASGAVAAGVVGVIADRTVLPGGARANPTTRPGARGALDLDDGTWQAVTTVSEVAAAGIVHFATPAVVGFVSERDEAIVAVSGTCTHLGCLLRGDEAAGRIDCPCHRTAFTYDGEVLFSQLDPPPPALPQLQARRNGDAVEVLVPRSTE